METDNDNAAVIFVTIADFNVQDVKSEVIYAGLNEDYARNVPQIIDDYEEGDFRTMLESIITSFRLEIWSNGVCISEAEPLRAY